MGAFKQMVFVICLSAISLSFFELLAPAKRFEKIFKLFISLYFLTVLIVPFTQVSDLVGEAETGLQGVEASYEDNSIKEMVNSRLNTQVKKTLELQFTSSLKEVNVTPKQIEVEFIQQEHEIEVTKVKVYVEAKKNYLDETIKTHLKKSVDCEIEIVKQ